MKMWPQTSIIAYECHKPFLGNKAKKYSRACITESVPLNNHIRVFHFIEPVNKMRKAELDQSEPVSE